MSSLGLALLALVGVLLVTTGMPAYAVLLGASVLGAAASVLSGQAPVALLGALLNRMLVVPALFKTLVWLLPDRAGGRLVSGLALGALLGPMSGSVGASVMALSRTVAPSLAATGVAANTRHAMVALASTLGVVVPPSLVLILLGDAMLAAHTIAINATGRADRIINTQDVMRSALVPALLVVVASLLIAWVQGNRAARTMGQPGIGRLPAERPTAAEASLALASLTLLLVLLGGVATGYFYAVEAAASGAVILFTIGLISRRLVRATLSPLLDNVLATTGALFAPLLAATTFTLVLRLLGTDKLIDGCLPGGEITAVCVILAAMALTAFVLDAFEIIFVIVPILVPPLLMRAADATWVSTLVLLTLQLSFLIPPAGYALMMTRGVLGRDSVIGETPPSSAAVTRALAPYLLAQVLILALVIAQPKLVHLLDPAGIRDRVAPGTAMSKEDIEKRFQQMQRPALPLGNPFGASSPATQPPRFD
jgi:TRAP-type mannitol/chloroaromatic compound transport system permease large subunit